MQRALTNQGNEYRSALIRLVEPMPSSTRGPNRAHSWTNAFVERLQGTILSELWRIEFRQRFFTRVATMQDVLDRYLAFYNHQRPHLGHRTSGRTPAEIFMQVQEVSS
ncbi:MAG: integrase core domain-containing protein [Armatimonadota bacterium]|nr:integrase core domain-containing protein [Armatimonadota bacterium]